MGLRNFEFFFEIHVVVEQKETNFEYITFKEFVKGHARRARALSDNAVQIGLIG